MVLSVAETSDALEKIADAADDAAGNIGGHIIAANKRRDDESEGGASDA